MNYKIKEMLRFLVMFPMMILSCAASGAFFLLSLLRLNPLYLLILMPLLFASVVSCRGFYQIMEKADSRSKRTE
jgi:membrane protein implicated in regulation of membrane protease activity